MERERIAARDLEVIIASGGNPYSELEGMLEQLVGTYPAIDQCVRFIWWHWTRFVRHWC
jgi:hypothetical protein